MRSRLGTNVSARGISLLTEAVCKSCKFRVSNTNMVGPKSSYGGYELLICDQLSHDGI